MKKLIGTICNKPVYVTDKQVIIRHMQAGKVATAILKKYIQWCKDNGYANRNVYFFAKENGIILE